VAGWNGENEKEIKPTQLRPQGHDIIRTWAFYTILRTRELIGKKPWDTIFINGMILGEDGYKMSKSRGNIIPPEEIIERYGVDVFRLWAASAGRPGSDILFRWEDIISSSRFIRKLWNVFRFCMIHLKDYDGEIPERINTIDSWLLSELHKTVGEVEGYMEDYSFDDAIKRIRSFLWNIFADNYIEMVKSRLYEKRDNSTLYTIKFTLDVLSRLLAPFVPYISEEIYSHLFEESPQSVHLQSYPDHSKIPFDERSHKIGEVMKDLVSSIRRYKSDQGMPLNKEVNLLEIHDEADIFSEGDLIDIKGTVGAREVKILRTKPTFNRKIIEVMPNMKKIGPKFREDSKIVAEKLREMEPEGDTVIIEIDGDEVELDSSYFDVKKEFLTKKGEKIKLLPIRDKVTVAVVV
jgi:valyl-tRNA synthetase